MKLAPEIYPTLKTYELDSDIILMHGIDQLHEEDVLEIVQFSISEHRKDALLH